MDPDLVAAVIEPISPSLAAYHFVRGRTRQVNPSRCTKCGYSLLYGTSHTRIVHNNSKTKQRLACLQRSCTTCGHVNNTLLQPPVCRDATRASPQVVAPRTLGTDQFISPNPPHRHHPLPLHLPHTFTRPFIYQIPPFHWLIHNTNR
jgi:predicted Zn-ribbon and HTH transcriptional regulator